MDSRKRNQTYKPSDVAILERAFSLVNEAMFAIDLQRRRSRSTEPEDKVFLFRWWVDLQFLIIALRRLRRAAELATRVQAVRDKLFLAVDKFDKAIPNLRVLRNVGEHIDIYALNDPKRHHKNVDSGMLQVGEWDGTTYKWLGEELNIDKAYYAAFELHQRMSEILKSLTKSTPS